MPPQEEIREYDIVLLGATGYTGKLTAQFITKQLPSNLKWAIAGRSKAKLQELAAELGIIKPDRSPPEIEIVDLEQANQVHAVVKKAKVCISVVTYWRVGETVIDACVKNKTDYVDTAGEIPLIKQWIEKYHKKAESEGTALIHGCGMFSGPQDLLSWVAARELRRSYGANTKEVILAIKKSDPNPSGGTFQSIVIHGSQKKESNVTEYPQNPWVISPISGTEVHVQTNALGLREDIDLGLLSEYTMSSAQNRVVVHRTWGLLETTKERFGPSFQYNEYESVGSTLGGFFKMLNHKILDILLSNTTTLSLLKLFMPAPGSGPDVRITERNPIELQALAIADEDNALRAFASFSFPSGAYHTTALFLGQAAASLLYSKSLQAGIKGGCLTPAILGDDLLDRLKEAGASVQVSSKKR